MTPAAASLLRDTFLAAWMFLVAAAFWGAYAAPGGLPAGIFTALYAAFLVLFVATAALRAVRRGGHQEGTAGPETVRLKEESRRGN